MNDILIGNIGDEVNAVKQLFLGGTPFSPKTMADAVYYADGEKLSEKDFLLKDFVQVYEIDAMINNIFG